MDRFLCFGIFLLLAVSAPAQDDLPRLAQIKAAAEKGDPIAQEQLGDQYRYRPAEALPWYRKAAEQGMPNSQYHVASILMAQATPIARTPANQAALADEALQWLHKAAYQGVKRAQLDLGRQYESGKFLKMDFAEAYKWYSLVDKGGNLLDGFSLQGTWARDKLILKMSQEEIAEGQKRFVAFVPRKATRDDLPEPSWVKELKLQSILGKPERRLALINGQTVAPGESFKLNIGGTRIPARCLEIKEQSVVLAIEGLRGNRELHLKN